MIGIQAAPIEPWIPLITFAVVFGLSMDYEVFLLSDERAINSAFALFGPDVGGRVLM